jgi:hypothetical protein
MSKTKANPTPEAVEAAPALDPVAANEAYMKETVEIELFYDGDRYKDDVLVGVNGKTWQIQRGVPVTVPRFVAEVIRNSELQDRASANKQRALESAFEREAKRYIGEE